MQANVRAGARQNNKSAVETKSRQIRGCSVAAVTAALSFNNKTGAEQLFLSTLVFDRNIAEKTR